MKMNLRPASKAKDRLRAVIYLFGEPNTGKSGVLQGLVHALREKGIYFYKQKEQARSRDERVVIKCGGRCIGIGTAGDTEQMIVDNLKFFKRQGCLIGILAARTCLEDFLLKKISKYKRVGVKKKDVESEYARGIVKGVTIDLLLQALERKQLKECLSHLKMSQAK